MVQRKLSSFYSSFCARTDLLLHHFLLFPPCGPMLLGNVPVSTLLPYSRGYLVNRLFHLWGEFCRHVVTASALGGYKTLNGNKLTGAQGISNISDILAIIKEASLSGPGLRWGEPAWTVRKANKIQPVNLQQITLGISAVPYDEFRRVRNFIIHSNPHTRSEFDMLATRYSLFGASADDLLLHRLPGGATVMEGWVRDFQIAALDVVR